MLSMETDTDTHVDAAVQIPMPIPALVPRPGWVAALCPFPVDEQQISVIHAHLLPAHLQT